jgi:phosphate transport system protein
VPEAAERKALGEGLQKLMENMRTMAELSELAIQKAVDALQRMDPVEAREVSTLDREIWSLQQVIEKSCIDLIALHAPVARDLRVITTSLKITTDLDRIGRYSKDIAEIAVQLEGEVPARFKPLEKLSRSADLTIHMVDRAIRAFLEREDKTVRDIARFDDAVDQLHNEIFQDLIRGLAKGSIPTSVGTRYILVNRALERIADHAVNIGVRVVYMVSGEAPKRASPASAIGMGGPK